jgi:hypothetical protein
MQTSPITKNDVKNANTVIRDIMKHRICIFYVIFSDAIGYGLA